MCGHRRRMFGLQVGIEMWGVDVVRVAGYFELWGGCSGRGSGYSGRGSGCSGRGSGCSGLGSGYSGRGSGCSGRGSGCSGLWDSCLKWRFGGEGKIFREGEFYEK